MARRGGPAVIIPRLPGGARVMTRAAVLLALLPHAAAWVNYYASELDPVSLIYRWDSPSEFSSDAGLGSGLTWAAQDDFCSKLLPRNRLRNPYSSRKKNPTPKIGYQICFFKNVHVPNASL